MVILSIVLVAATLVWGPSAYKESWLDPFSTLNIPNRELHPQAIKKLGMINSDDPFHPLYYTNEGKILELMRNLQRATPLSSEHALLALENPKIKYFTLHRENEVETKLIEKRLEIIQIEEQIKGLAEQKAEIQTQVDQALSYIEMVKGSFTSELALDKEL